MAMRSKIERKWWFLLPVSALAAFLTVYFMDTAEINRPYNFAQWVLYVLCFAGLQRGLSFAAWLLVLAVSPSDGVRERMR
jgi:type II secretory pathway component PulF